MFGILSAPGLMTGLFPNMGPNFLVHLPAIQPLTCQSKIINVLKSQVG